jgi:hypothetical protein
MVRKVGRGASGLGNRFAVSVYQFTWGCTRSLLAHARMSLVLGHDVGTEVKMVVDSEYLRRAQRRYHIREADVISCIFYAALDVLVGSGGALPVDHRAKGHAMMMMSTPMSLRSYDLRSNLVLKTRMRWMSAATALLLIHL